jgi:hypothetical protein
MAYPPKTCQARRPTIGAEGTTNQQFGRRQKIFIFKGVDPWVASWNVVFPEEVVIVTVVWPGTETVEVFWDPSGCKILMSLLLESVEPLDNC